MSNLDDMQQQITNYWNLRSDSYDASGRHQATGAEREAWLRALRALMPPAPADVLDVGTGTGFLALLLAELGYRVTAIDLAEAMMALGQTKSVALVTPPAFRVGDAVNPPVEPASFDVVTSRHVLWTLRDLPAALANWRRALRPGGRVVAIDGLWWLDPKEAAALKTPEPDTWQEKMANYYTDAVKQSLPLMSAQGFEPVLDQFRAAGFEGVRLSHLEEVERIEREQNPAMPSYPPRYVVTGTRKNMGYRAPNKFQMEGRIGE